MMIFGCSRLIFATEGSTFTLNIPHTSSDTPDKGCLRVVTANAWSAPPTKMTTRFKRPMCSPVVWNDSTKPNTGRFVIWHGNDVWTHDEALDSVSSPPPVQEISLSPRIGATAPEYVTGFSYGLWRAEAMDRSICIARLRSLTSEAECVRCGRSSDVGQRSALISSLRLSGDDGMPNKRSCLLFDEGAMTLASLHHDRVVFWDFKS
jgi:hypothetical protein